MSLFVCAKNAKILKSQNRIRFRQKKESFSEGMFEAFVMGKNAQADPPKPLHPPSPFTVCNMKDLLYATWKIYCMQHERIYYKNMKDLLYATWKIYFIQHERFYCM